MRVGAVGGSALGPDSISLLGEEGVILERLVLLLLNSSDSLHFDGVFKANLVLDLAIEQTLLVFVALNFDLEGCDIEAQVFCALFTVMGFSEHLGLFGLGFFYSQLQYSYDVFTFFSLLDLSFILPLHLSQLLSVCFYLHLHLSFPFPLLPYALLY